MFIKENGLLIPNDRIRIDKIITLCRYGPRKSYLENEKITLNQWAMAFFSHGCFCLYNISYIIAFLYGAFL